MANATVNQHLEDAIRAMNTANVLPLLPEGDPSKPGFDIHSHLASTQSLLDRYLPMPAVPVGVGAAVLAACNRTRTDIRNKRVNAILAKMMGPAREAIELAPAGTFTGVIATKNWLIDKFEGPHYEANKRTIIYERKQHSDETVQQYIWELKKHQRNLNQHLAGQPGPVRNFTDDDLLSILIANALPIYKKKLLTNRPASIDIAERIMLQIEAAQKACPDTTKETLENLHDLIMKSLKGDSQEQKVQSQDSMLSTAKEDFQDTLKKIGNDMSQNIKNQVSKALESVNAISWQNNNYRGGRYNRGRGQRGRGYRGRGQRYTPYGSFGRGNGQQCRNCKKKGHHHSECYAPPVCFKCGASTKDHYSYECPKEGNKDKDEKYLSLYERMSNIQIPYQLIDKQEEKGKAYCNNAKYRKYRQKLQGYTQAELSMVDPGSRLPVLIEKTKTQALIDTGANISIISVNLLNRLHTKRKVKIMPWKYNPVRLADQRPVMPIGIVSLTVKIGHKTKVHRFVVMDWTSHGLIFGRDLMRETHMIIDIGGEKIYFKRDSRSVKFVKENLYNPTAALFSLDTTILPPLTQTIIDCVTAKTDSVSNGIHTGWIVSHDKVVKQKGIVAEKGYQIIKEGKTRVAISNLSKEEQILQIGQVVANFIREEETKEEDEVQVINNINFCEEEKEGFPAANTVNFWDAGRSISVAREKTDEQESHLSVRDVNFHAELERPVYQNPRKVTGVDVGKNHLDTRDVLIDDTARDVSTILSAELGPPIEGYRSWTKGVYRGTHTLLEDHVETEKEKENRKRKRPTGKERRTPRRKQENTEISSERLAEPEKLTRLGIDLSNSKLNSEEEKQLSHLLEKYVDLFAQNPKRPGRTKLTKHQIDTGDHAPINLAPYRLSPNERKKVSEEVKEMLDNDIIRPSRSPWASPVVLVTKKDGGIRFCTDYRKINAITKKDVYPLPRIDDALDALHKSKIFSTLDLASGYWQIEMDPKDREKTAFICEQGLFEYNIMPFGLCNAPATFQRLMDAILAGLKWTCCLVYLDDIIIYSESFEDHLKHLSMVFQRLQEAGLNLKASKCHFAKSYINYLGHVVSDQGISPDPKKVEAVKDFPKPKSLREVRSFLGLTSYYRRFIKDYAKIAVPINHLLKADVKFEWTLECQKAFEHLKDLLTKAPILSPPDFTEVFKLQTDASDQGLGAVLAQDIRNREHVIAYASRTLSSAEIKWDTREKEALAIVWGCEHFRPYLIGQFFIIETDHGSLRWLMNVQKGRLARWGLRLSEFDFQIKHKPGKFNGNADGISRMPLPNSNTDSTNSDEIPYVYAIDFNFDNQIQIELLIAKQKEDIELSVIRTYLTDGIIPEDPKLARKLKSPKQPYIMDRDILKKKNIIQRGGRMIEKYVICVPQKLISSVLHQAHKDPLAGHVGIEKTYQKIREQFYWKKMKNHIYKYIMGCLECQVRRTKAPIHHGLLQHLPLPEQPFDIVDIDFLDGLPKTMQGNSHVLVVIDRLTGYPIAIPTPDNKAETAAEAIYKNVICEYGVPRCIHSDKGTHFTGNVFKRLCKRMNIQQTYTTTAHPQGNALPERFNQFLKKCLSIFAEEEIQKDWDKWLPSILFAYRTSIHPAAKDTPFYLLHGFDATQPLEIEYGSAKKFIGDIEAYKLQNTLRTRLARKAAIQVMGEERAKHKEIYDKTHKEIIFQEGDLVLLWNPLKLHNKDNASSKLLVKYIGPYRIIRKISPVIYEIMSLFTKKKQMIHVQRLQLYNPWKLNHIDEIESQENTPMEEYTQDFTDFTKQKQKKMTQEKVIKKPIRQKIEMYVDVPEKEKDSIR